MTGITRAGAVALATVIVASLVPLVSLQAVAAVESTPPTTAQPVPAAGAGPRQVASGWITYWNLDEGMSSVLHRPELFRDVALFWFAATKTSKVVEQEPGAQPAESTLLASVQELQAEGLPVYLSVNDQGMDATVMSRLLGDKERRALLITNLAATAERLGADGIDIDFESMNEGSVGAHRTAVKRLFPVFLSKLDARLEQAGRRLSVALPPRTGGQDGAWEVFDYRAIAPEVDRARVMTYDYHGMGGPSGPIAPFAWTDDVARYVGATFGRKASLGLPAFGYNWFVKRISGGACPSLAVTDTSGSTRDFAAIAKREDVVPNYVRSASGYTYTYRRVFTGDGLGCKVERRVWYEDWRSVKDKLRLLTRHGLGTVALWQLGGERPATWKVLTDYATR
jgi:spore germination protein